MGHWELNEMVAGTGGGCVGHWEVDGMIVGSGGGWNEWY